MRPIDRGPGAGPEAGSPPVPESRRPWGLFRRKAEQPAGLPDGSGAAGFPRVDGKGIDPVVQTGTLEALLTRLVRALLADGLVDQSHLLLYPVVPGAGAKLFPEGAAGLRLTLAASQAFDDGVVHLTYAPAG